MFFDFIELKSQARQALHDAMAVPAQYTDADFVIPVDITVRWHNKIDRFGDIVDTGYSELIDGINRVIFNVPELVEKELTISRGGHLQLTDPRFGGATLVLDSMEPRVGPVEEIWLVGHIL